MITDSRNGHWTSDRDIASRWIVQEMHTMLRRETARKANKNVLNQDSKQYEMAQPSGDQSWQSIPRGLDTNRCGGKRVHGPSRLPTNDVRND